MWNTFTVWYRFNVITKQTENHTCTHNHTHMQNLEISHVYTLTFKKYKRSKEIKDKDYKVKNVCIHSEIVLSIFS